MQRPTTEGALRDFVVTHPLDPEDAKITAAARAMASPMKGKLRGIEAREPFDAMMERVSPRDDVSFEVRHGWRHCRASGFILRMLDLTRRFSICTPDGSTWEAPKHSAILSGTSPRGRARAHLSRTIGLLPSILFPRPSTMCWRVTAGSRKGEFAGLPSRETLPEVISPWYSPHASPPTRSSRRRRLLAWPHYRRSPI